MLLVLDMGNTNITLGVFDGDRLLLQSRIATDRTKMEDQYAVELMDLLRLYKLEVTAFSGAILSSVVPPPSTQMTEPPAPRTRWPMATRKLCRSTISGSRAALQITVSPSANTAASNTFSVAPTLGNDSVTVAPCRPFGAVQCTIPPSSHTVTPIRRSADK